MAIISTTGTGAAITPTEYADYFFTHLHAQSVGLACGFRVVTTEATSLSIPRLNADVTANWTTEADEITPSDPTADEVVAVPRKLAALSYVSNEVVEDSNPDVLDLLAESMARAMALKLDLGFFEGTGTAPQIRGLRHVTGVQTVPMGTTSSGAPLANLDPVADALGLLAEANAVPGAIVMHPRVWRELTKLKDSTGSNKPLLVDAAPTATVGGTPNPARVAVGTVYGVPVHLTSQLSTAASGGSGAVKSDVYVLDPVQVVAVLRRDTTIVADSSARFSSDQTAVRATMRADLVVPNPTAVVKITNVVT